MTHSLAGKRIVNTRAVHQAPELDVLLREHGAESLSYPCLAIAPPEQTDELDDALNQMATGGFDWLVLTSANTVYSLAQRLNTLRLSLKSVRVAAIGEPTARTVRAQLAIDVDLIPEEFSGETLAYSLKNVRGLRILLPVSDIAPTTLADALRESGALVTRVVACRTLPGSGGVDIPSRLAERRVDAVMFTSPSTVRNFIHRLDTEGGNRAHLDEVCVACIGPQTTQAAREYGLSITIMATVHTIQGLVAGLESYFENVRTGAQ
jgi:uroporphyrinogen-III synthase